MWSQPTLRLIEAACEEDLGATGDTTSALLTDAGEVEGRVVSRQPGVVCGLTIGPLICETLAEHLDQPIGFATAGVSDGDRAEAGQTIATVRGSRGAVLAAERTLLNFLGRMSGVATLTHRFVQAARAVNPDVQVLDTRKTIPGWRELDKYAVRCGGGTNHRFGLYDAVLIKDNHLAGIPTERLAAELFDMLNRLPALSDETAAPSSRQHGQADKSGAPHAARAASELQAESGRETLGHGTRPKFVEVEVDGLAQLAQVLRVVGIDIVLLDNFTPDQMREAVARRDAAGLRGKLALEASGRVTLESVAAIAATGVDRIAVGALTHSAPSLDIGLDF